MEYLPNEILELICTSDPATIIQDHIRYQLANTCRTLLRTLCQGKLKRKHSKAHLAAGWILLGKDFEWIIQKKFCTALNLTKAVALTGDFDKLKSALTSGYKFDDAICQIAIVGNRLDILKYSHENKHVNWLSKVYMSTAALHGRLDCLKYLFDHYQLGPGQTYVTSDCCALAASNGHLGVLQFLHDQGVAWNSSTCVKAAENNQLHCLQYVCDNGCPWTEAVCAYLALHGAYFKLKWAHESGCPWSHQTLIAAATNGHLDCLTYAHTNGCPTGKKQGWDIGIIKEAAKGGHLLCLQYAHDSGSKMDRRAAYWACANGHLDCLRYCHQAGCVLQTDFAVKAAENGHLACLKYLHQNGCVMRQVVCEKAAFHGHLDCLQYTHRAGVELNMYISVVAAKNSHLDCLMYAHAHGEWNWSDVLFHPHTKVKNPACYLHVPHGACREYIQLHLEKIDPNHTLLALTDYEEHGAYTKRDPRTDMQFSTKASCAPYAGAISINLQDVPPGIQSETW